jgi:F-type H+-transporting ATPase subunit a
MEPHIEVTAETIGHLGPLPITNSMILTWIVMAVLLVFAYLASKTIRKVPTRLQNFAEMVVEGLHSTVSGLAGPLTDRIFPLIATFFIFIMVSNYFGLLPGIGTIGIKEVHDGHEVLVPLFRPPAADLNFTLALALISVVLTHYFSITTIGVGAYLARYFSLNPIYLFVGFLEIIAEFTKVISLSFRLFGNIFAGEALLVTISSLLAFLAPLPFMMLELLVGFVQATVFMMLTLVFITILAEKHEAH